MTSDRSDPAKDAINRVKHKLPLSFGDRIFEDDNHLLIPSIREVDGEERFKVVGVVDEKLFTGVFVWRADLPRFMSVRRSNKVKREPMLPVDPTDAEDFDVTADALDRSQRARLIRKTRTGLGMSQSEFASRFRVPVGTLRDWEQARSIAPDFAIAYVRVIGQHPDMVAKAVA
jgi:putative transcriptional regulator